MSGLDLKAVHEALAAQIRSRVADAGKFTIGALPLTVARPSIEVWPDVDYVTYYETSGSAGLADVQLLVRVFLSGNNIETEWLTAMRLLSAGTGHSSSIVDAIMSDRTLGGVVADAFAGSARYNPEEGTIEIPVDIQLNKQGAQV